MLVSNVAHLNEYVSHDEATERQHIENALEDKLSLQLSSLTTPTKCAIVYRKQAVLVIIPKDHCSSNHCSSNHCCSKLALLPHLRDENLHDVFVREGWRLLSPLCRHKKWSGVLMLYRNTKSTTADF